MTGFSKDSLSLDGQIVVVTGGTRGIGLAVSHCFARCGAIVFVVGSDEETAQETANELTNLYKSQCFGIGADSRNAKSVSAVYQSVFRRYQRLDGLVNNAGILEDALIGMIDQELISRVFETNTFGAINHLQGAARLMSKVGGGSITNISSIVGVQGNTGQLVYSASKAAVIGLTKSASKELAPVGIRVNAIAPGLIDTDMARSVMPEKIEALTNRIAMGRIGTPNEVARVALFLQSSLAEYVTGQIIGVDGGMSI